MAERRRISYELRVGTHVATEALATFRVPVRPTAVPRRTLYRFLVPDDRDLAATVDRLIAADVEIVEIRRCSRPRPRERAPVPEAAAEPSRDGGQGGGQAGEDDVGVVVPFRGRGGRRSSPA